MKTQKTLYTIRINTNSLNALREVKKNLGISVSESVNIAIEKHIRNLSKKRNIIPF